MTCIAYDGTTMSADSLRTHKGDVMPVAARKIQRVTHREAILYVGLAGFHHERDELLQRFIQHKVGAELNSSLLVANLAGAFHRCYVVDEYGAVTEITGQPFAIGSGADYATGAMLAGASSRRAVSIAAARCATVGGPIRTVKVGKPSPAPDLRPL